MLKQFVLLPIIFVFTAAFCLAFAADKTPAERGKDHFNNPAFAGGKKSCNTCHPDGRGLKASGAKSSFNIMGGHQNSLEEAINACIVYANKGKTIALDSPEMQDLVSYIKSLGEK